LGGGKKSQIPFRFERLLCGCRCSEFKIRFVIHMEAFVSIVSVLICLALLPGSFIGAALLAKKMVKETAGRVLLTIGLGLVFLVAGVAATLAGCIALYPPNFR
jgi:hypothetical protein